jgi:hypothetical protein
MGFRTMVIVLGSLGLAFSAMAQEARVETSGGAAQVYAAGASPQAAQFSGPGRGADCDGNGTIDNGDLPCFMRRFAAGDPRADCDGSGALDVRDFLCFHDRFVAGFSWPAAAQASLKRAVTGEWCLTHQRYIAELQALGGQALEASCALGPCDNPAVRNSNIPGASTPIKTYRLYFNVFCENNGSNCAATANDVANAVDRVNDQFAPWRIQFVYEVRFINNTTYRILDSGEEWHMKRTYATSPATKLNVYVVDTGGFCWGTFPWMASALDKQGGIVMHYTTFAPTYPLRHLLAHEIGHCLGLWHTFHGVDEVPQCGDCYEYAGRSPEEGDVTGDLCADTQPTPKNTNQCVDPAAPDVCSGNPWLDTPYLNYMGYSHMCPGAFSAQQAGRMHCWTEDRLSGWLVQPVPPAAPGAPTLTKLSGGQVRVQWADNSSNEDGFRVERETKVGSNWTALTTVATVGMNVTETIDAPGTGTFRYRVQAFNASGSSAWSAWKQIKL